MNQRKSSLLLVVSGCAILFWLALTWVLEVMVPQSQALAAYLFAAQDLPALALGAGVLILLNLFIRTKSGYSWQWVRSGRVLPPVMILFALIAWTGRYWLFGDYALSRDEQVAEFAAVTMRHGWLGWPIPSEWIDYRRAIMPEFFSPFGADHVWTAAYLPLNAAFRAFWSAMGEPNLASPLFLLIGLLSLWRVALRVFPDRPDAVAVAVLMALSSTQLLVTAMTPYAMTGHFALNMLWLALVLRGGMWGHGAAGLVALMLVGLHQYHYPLPFLLPFLLWFALGRRWGLFLFHGAMLAMAVLLWAKLWPSLLIELHGAAADVRPSAGVGDKMGSLFDRLFEKWHPGLHLSRFLAWNNLLLVPLAFIAVGRMDWRAALRGEALVLPLALGTFGMAAMSIDQGYGWGYRYLHGFIGSFALLAGYGWMALRRPDGKARGASLTASLLVALLTGSFLMMRTHDYVMPYAKAHHLIVSNKADVVLVDPRGGRFVSDLVRGKDGQPLGKPVVMAIGMLDEERLDRLCDNGTVAIFDRSAFLPLGVSAVNFGNIHIAALRTYLDRRACGHVITVQGVKN